MIDGEQYLLVDVECYGCKRLVALTYAQEIDGRKFCPGCVRKRPCTTCKKSFNVSSLCDELSICEFGISGMCQECQDSVFGVE